VRRLLTTVFDFVGAAAVVAGIAFIYWPAAVIVAGVTVVAMSYVQAAPPARHSKADK
jgi:hypothetical protein